MSAAAAAANSGRFVPPFTVTQQKVLAIVPKITSSFSIIGSSYIICHIIRRPKLRSKVYHRLLLVMSCMDLIFSIKSFLSTWIMPSTTPFVWGAIGTFTTCDVWAFIGHGSSLSSALYNGTLATYFTLTIAFEFRERDISRKWIEYTLHLAPLIVGWGTAIVSLSLDQHIIGPIGWTCWIGTYPPGCGTRYPCIRGNAETINLFRLVLFYIWLWASFLVCLMGMIAIFIITRRQERRMVERYSFRHSVRHDHHAVEAPIITNTTHQNVATTTESTQSSSALPASGDDALQVQSSLIDNNNNNDNNNRAESTLRIRQQQQQRSLRSERPTSLSTKVAVQAFLYVFFFFVTWIFPMTQFIASEVTGVLYFPLLCLTTILLPLQGFFDAFIYLRPRFLEYKRIQRRRRLSRSASRGASRGGSGDGGGGNNSSDFSIPQSRVTALSRIVQADDVVEGETFEATDQGI